MSDLTIEQAEREYLHKIRIAALQAAATFCAPYDKSTGFDVKRIASQFEEYIFDGVVGEDDSWAVW